MTERYRVRVRGEGRVVVAGYGVADAEHRVEKELGRLWPGARVSIRDVARSDDRERIVEEFEVGFRLEGEVQAEAESAERAVREAFREARTRLEGSRYWKTSWESVEAGRLGG